MDVLPDTFRDFIFQVKTISVKLNISSIIIIITHLMLNYIVFLLIFPASHIKKWNKLQIFAIDRKETDVMRLWDKNTLITHLLLCMPSFYIIQYLIGHGADASWGVVNQCVVFGASDSVRVYESLCHLL